MPGVVFPAIDFALMIPQLIVLGLVLLLIAADLIFLERHERVLTWLSLLGYAAALAATVILGVGGLPGIVGPRYSGATLNGMLRWDATAIFFMIVILASALLTVLISDTYGPYRRLPMGEFYTIMALGTLGMMLTASAGDLVMVFVGIELSSISVYILTGFQRNRAESLEAAIKYFLLGLLATAILTYGMAWLFGLTGQTNLTRIAQYLTATPALQTSPALLFALLLLVTGLGFKAAAVPFHMWTPDAYSGAPTPVTAFMSAGPKAAAFAALVRVLVEAMSPLAQQWILAIMVLSVMTMALGNLVAIAQRNVKRMLAYSSIAHTGYMLAGLAAFQPGSSDQGVPAMLFYTFAYVFMNIGAFGVVIWLQSRGGGTDIDDFNGLASRAALPALALAVFLMSLMGLPPLIGFWAKYYVIVALIQADLVWLAVIVVLTSAISAYFYLRVIAAMYFGDQEEELPHRRTPLLQFGLLAAAIATVVFGIFSGPVLTFARTYYLF